MRAKTLPGVNIQYPISRQIAEGSKVIETRTYPLPSKYVGIDLFLVETPGRSGGFKSRVIGIIRFESSYKYRSKREFYRDFPKHHVDENSPWAWKEKQKWAWPIAKFTPIKSRVVSKRLGIVFTKQIGIS